MNSADLLILGGIAAGAVGLVAWGRVRRRQDMVQEPDPETARPLPAAPSRQPAASEAGPGGDAGGCAGDGDGSCGGD